MESLLEAIPNVLRVAGVAGVVSVRITLSLLATSSTWAAGANPGVGPGVETPRPEEARTDAPGSTLPEGGTVLDDEGLQPRVAVNGADGAVHVAYIHGGNVVVRSARTSGAGFEPRVTAIEAGGAARGGRQRGPRIVLDGSGRVFVTSPLTFDPVENTQRYPRPELYLVESGDGGRTWSKPLRVNEVERKAPEGLHWTAGSPRGGAFIAWLDLRLRERGQDIFLARYVDGKVSEGRRVAEDVCECCAPGLAVDPSGNPVLAWREGGDKPSREILAARSLDGGATFGPPRRLNSESSNLTTCPMSAPAVALSPDGKLLAFAWMDERASSGSRDVFWCLGPDLPAGRDARVHSTSRGKQDHPGLAFTGSGSVACVWRDGRGGSDEIWLRRGLDGAERRLSAPGKKAGYPAVAAGPGFLAVAYEELEGDATRVVLVRSSDP